MTKHNEYKNIPELRFPEFKDDGEWEEKTLGELAELTSSKRVYLADYVSNGIPFYRGKEISQLKNNQIPDDILYISIQQYNEIKEKYGVPKKGEILITAVGTLGNVYCIKNNNVFYFKDGNLIWLRNISISPNFLEILLDVEKDKVLASAIGSSQKALTMAALNKLKFKIPDNPKEQQKIADCLSSMDEIINAHSDKLEILKDHKKGLMQVLIPQEGKNVPKYRFKEFENDKEWKNTAFKNYVLIIDGDRGINYPKSEEYSSKGYCVFLNAKNVTKEGFAFNEIQFITKERDELLRKGKLEKLDIVLTTRGTLGQFAFFSESVPFQNIRINSGMVILRAKDNIINQNYLYNYCRSNIIQSEIKSRAFGNAVQQLTVSIINSFPLIFPENLKEQTKIADTLSSIDDLIVAQSEKIEELKAHKKGLMQKLFPVINE